jgi:uncharacterized lipoprotein NlpE involved in copper resistance
MSARVRHRSSRVARVVLESLEDRRLLSGPEGVAGYLTRAQQVLDGNVTTIRTWNTTNAALTAETASVTGISMWTVAAAYARAQDDPTLLPIAHKAAAAMLSREVTSLFVGGNDGWPAWATADTYVRYRSVIDAATERYAPPNFAANANSPDGRYTLAELFKYVLTQSYYAPIDSTSNHYLMNATACYLANQAFPGQVVKPFNNSTSDPTGAVHILSRARGITTSGPGEFLSPNYGVANWAEFLSIYQLGPANTTLTNASRVAFETSLAMNAGYWMNGQVSGPTGRGYPNTGAWGAAGGDTLIWTYLGGDYGQPAQQLAYALDDDVKSFAVLASQASVNLTHAGAPAAYVPPASILSIDDESKPLVIRSHFNGDYQYSYDAGSWATYSDSFNWNAQGGAAWRNRTIWTKPEHQSYNAVSWAVNPSTSATVDAQGRWTYVNPDTLETFQLYGSGTYGGGSPFTSQVQNLNTVLQGFNIPPRSTGITPGGGYIVRGALIYVPIPKVTATGAEAADGDGWFRPVISADGKRLFVAYNSVFICYLSSAPISLGTKIGNMQFYNVYGGDQPGQTVDPETYLQFAIAQENVSPSDVPGTTLAEKFANFQTVMNGRDLPTKTKDDTFHPAWRYSDEKATLTTEYGSPARYARDPKTYTRGIADDYLGDVSNADPQVIDYDQWPFFDVADASTGQKVVSMPEGGNMNVTAPGSPATYYDFLGWRIYSGNDVALRATYLPTGTVRLDWNALPGATGFTVQRSTDGNTWTTLSSTVAGNATTYADSTALQETNYYYRVVPTGAAPDANRPVSLTTAFRAPTNLRLSVNTLNNITLTWTNNATGYNAIQLQYSPDGYNQWAWLENFLNASANTRSFTHADFTGDERLFYRVVAYGAGPNGTTLYSAPSNVVGTQLSTPFLATGGNAVSMPRLPRARANPAGSQITVTWQDTAYNETAYRVERSSDNGATWTTLTATLPANSTTFSDVNLIGGTTYAYRVTPLNGATAGPSSTVVTARAVVANAAPTVAQPAAAAVSPVTTTSTTLTVLGADDAGEANLEYFWSVSAGPGAVAFSANYVNGSKQTVATFSRAGTYTLLVTIVDAQGLRTTSSVQVEVQQRVGSIQITPGKQTIATNGTLQLAATQLDQFGFPMTTPATITWRTTAGSINASGLFTAPATNGLAVISASNGAAVGTAEVTYQTIGLPLAAYSFEDGTGATAVDSSTNRFDATLLGGVSFGAGATIDGRATGGLVFTGNGRAVIGDPAALQITGAITLAAWVKASGSAGIQSIIEKGYNTAGTRGEIFLRINAGKYEVGSWNGGNNFTSVAIPAGDTGNWVHLLGTYDAVAGRWNLYRNGVLLSSAATTTGAVLVTNRKWTIGSTDIPDRYFTGSIDEVMISNRTTSAADALAIYNGYNSPAIVAEASASLATSATATLSVRANSPAGESTLRYTWAVLGTPPAPVTFSANDSNAAKDAVATFTQPGVYRFVVTVRDAAGNAVASYATVTVVDPVPPRVSSAAFLLNGVDRPTIRIDFSEPLVSALTPNQFTVLNRTTGTPIPSSQLQVRAVSPTRYEVTFTGATNGILPNANYRLSFTTGAFSDVAGNANAEGYSFDFRFMNGDATGDGRVNFDDLLILAANYNTTGQQFSTGDFTFDGRVNFDDLLVLAANYNTTLAGAAALVAPPAGSANDDGSDTGGLAGDVLA